MATVKKERQAAMQWYNYLLGTVNFDTLPKDKLELYNLSSPFMETTFGRDEYKTLDEKHFLLLRGIKEGVTATGGLATYIGVSAPAVYPLIHILVVRQYILAAVGDDKKKQYTLLPYGRQKLQEWELTKQEK